MSLVRCPTCNRWFESEQSKAMPFCSVRCQQVDLGRWLEEKHGLPYEGKEEESEEGGEEV